jgi:ribonuclease III
MRHPKAALVERAQAEGRGKPAFATVRSGPDHEPLFTSEASLDGTVYGSGEGSNKREAERHAAEAALAALDRAALGGSEVDPDDLPFEGPWPLVEGVLAASLHVAHARVAAELRGDAAREAVQAFALKLYKGILQDLGEVVEDDDADAA